MRPNKQAVTGAPVRAVVDALAIAPRPIDAPVLQRFAAVPALELLDQRLDALGLVARRDQHRVSAPQ